tara:strand:- start:2955 stop:3143 length:189 start_codon:yes stop_codon:yes gene_type:complete
MKIKIGTILRNKHNKRVAEVHAVETVQVKIGESITVYVLIYEDGYATRSNEFYINKNWEIVG